MIDNKIKTIAEQTTFLLEKQKELFNFSADTYNFLLALIEEKLASANSQTNDDLKAIQKHMKEHKQKSEGFLKEDVDFLQEQFDIIKKIQTMEDKQKAQELFNMIIEENEELENMEEFKKQVEQNFILSKNDLTALKDDIQSAIEEGDIHTLKLMLDTVAAENETEQKSECDCCDCGCECRGGCNDSKDLQSSCQDDCCSECDCCKSEPECCDKNGKN